MDNLNPIKQISHTAAFALRMCILSRLDAIERFYKDPAEHEIQIGLIKVMLDELGIPTAELSHEALGRF